MNGTKENVVTANPEKETKGKKVFMFNGNKKPGFKKDFKGKKPEGKRPEKPATDQAAEGEQKEKKPFKKREDNEGRNLYPILELMDEKSRKVLMSLAK